MTPSVDYTAPLATDLLQDLHDSFTKKMRNIPSVDYDAPLAPSGDLAELRGALTDKNEAIQRDLATDTILRDILKEMDRQVSKWGAQRHPDGTGASGWTLKAETIKRENDQRQESGVPYWSAILEEEMLEAFAEQPGSEAMRKELIESAAVIVSWLQDLDTR